MDNFDKRLKEIAKKEKWEVPKKIDNKINSILNEINKPKVKGMKSMKVALITALIITFTGATGFAVEKIVKYFNYNKESSFIHSSDDIEKISENINLKAKDKGIEFILDNISVDDNYINVFYTVKSDKKIKDINKDLKDAFTAQPYVSIKVNGKEVEENHKCEYEAIFTSDNELKGMRRVNISSLDIKDKFKMDVYLSEIFNQSGNWLISTNVDKTKGAEKTIKYNVNKKASINIEGKKCDITIDKVNISSLASQIIISQKVNKENYFLGEEFALFDQGGNSLDIISKGSTMYEDRVSTNSIEFIKANENTSKLTLVPIGYTENDLKILEPKDIDKLPLEFKLSEYGSLVVEDIKITDKNISFVSYNKGVCHAISQILLFDKEGDSIPLENAVSKKLVNRHTGRYTYIYEFNKPLKDYEKIAKVSFFDSNIKLLYDQKIDINLK